MPTVPKSVEANWKFFVIILVPILLLFVLFIPVVPLKSGSVSKESACLYIVAIMVCYWLLNAMPLVVTALIPLAIVPLFGITDGKELAKHYMREPTMLVFGALMIACAFLGSELHKRMALRILSCTGNSTLRIVSAVFVCTLGFSMLITSVAGSLIMVATTISIIEQREMLDEEPLENPSNTDFQKGAVSTELRQSIDIYPAEMMNADDRATSFGSTASTDEKLKEIESSLMEPENKNASKNENKNENTHDGQEFDKLVEPVKESETDKESKLNSEERDIINKKLKRQFFITIYVAANIGSLFLPWDTAAANILYDWADLRKNKIIMGKNQVNSSMALSLRQNGSRAELTTVKWILYVLPTLVILSGIAWFYLSFIFTRLSPVLPGTSRLFSRKTPEEIQALSMEKTFYKGRYLGLGKFTFHQIVVIVLTVFLFFLWAFRDPRTFDGWARIIPNQGGKNTKVKAGYSAPAILIVTIMFMIPRFGNGSKPTDKALAILSWKFLETQVLWNLLLLMGGCFALVETIHRSGLSILLLKYYNELAVSFSQNVVHISCITMSLLLTELCSGVTSVCSMVQVFVVISRFHPTLGYTTLPITVMSILSFMFPVATPSNALVFTTAAGDLKVLDMIKYGALLDLISWVVVILVDLAYGSLIFDRE